MTMDLESRTFAKFYPAILDDKSYLSRSHGVKSAGFRLMPNFYYDFGIYSPSAQNNERRYELSFIKHAPIEEALPENYFRGLLGESLMRIVTMEFLRQQQQSLGIKEFSMIKIDKEQPVLRKSKEFSLEHISRYTVNLYKHDQSTHLVGEYDGMIQYTTFTNKKGLLIMESKTGKEGIFKNPHYHQSGVLDRYCHSVNNLFPDHEIDFLFMGTTDIVFSRPHDKRKLRPNFSSLKSMLSEYNVGLIMFEFPLKQESFKVMGQNMANYHTLRNEDIPLDSSQNKFVQNGKFMWLIRDKNIVKILERKDTNVWQEIYSI